MIVNILVDLFLFVINIIFVDIFITFYKKTSRFQKIKDRSVKLINVHSAGVENMAAKMSVLKTRV